MDGFAHDKCECEQATDGLMKEKYRVQTMECVSHCRVFYVSESEIKHVWKGVTLPEEPYL
jgi:hypothetical protein